MIINNKDRKVLGEGRSYGLGFAFAKKIRNNYECIMPITACKDYLNDVVYSEKTGNNLSAYGFNSEKTNCFLKSKAFIAISTLHYKNGSKYNNFEKEVSLLKDNFKNLELFLNKFEEILGWSKTKIVQEEENMYLLHVPINWCKTTYGISMYTLLCRIGRWYNGIDDVIDYIANFKDFNPDIYLCNTALPKIKNFLNNKPVEQDFDEELVKKSSVTNVHNKGICSYL